MSARRLNAPVAHRAAEQVFAPGAEGDPRTIVALHGTGGDARDMVGLAQALAPGAAVLALQGDVNEGGHARFFRRRAEGVYDMDDLARAIERFDAWVAPALAAEGRSQEIAFGFGFSNGANLLAAHLFERGPVLSRVALGRPLIPYEPVARDLSGASALIAAGRWDPIAPVAQSERLAAALEARGAAVETLWADAGHGLTGQDADALRRFLAAPEA